MADTQPAAATTTAEFDPHRGCISPRHLWAVKQELLQPLNVLRNLCSALAKTPLSPQQGELAGAVLKSAETLGLVLEDVLDDAQRWCGRGCAGSAADPDMLRVADVLYAVVRDAPPLAPRPGVRLLFEVGEGVPRSALGDVLRYRRVVENFVANAVAATEEGSVVVEAAVMEEGVGDNSFVLVTTVTDTGAGVSEAVVEELFKTPGDRASREEDEKGEKNRRPLGLWMSKILAEAMGGEIGYRPNPGGKGSVFWFTARFKRLVSLPPPQSTQNPTLVVAPAAAPVELRPVFPPLPLQGPPSLSAFGPPDRPLEATREPQPPPPPPRTAEDEAVEKLKQLAPRRHIFIAEDNAVNRKLLGHLLKKLGFPPDNVTMVVNGAEAVDRLLPPPQPQPPNPAAAVGIRTTTGNINIGGEPPYHCHLVLMDETMPVMGGLEATTRLRAGGFRRPIIAVMATMRLGQRPQWRDAGADEVIVKPYIMKKLARVLWEWLPKEEEVVVQEETPPEIVRWPVVQKSRM